MGAIDVDTDLGPIRFLGRDAGAPVVLVITGAFAMENQVDRLQDRFPSLDVLRAHLPGNHSPPMDIPSVGVFGAAFTAALDARFPGRPLVLVGLSVGALVAMATRARGTRAMLLVEPPLVITEAWPLEALPREAPPGNEEFLWNVFGLGRAVIEPRDYRPLVSQIGVPAHVLLGDPPPPRGPWGNTMPGRGTAFEGGSKGQSPHHDPRLARCWPPRCPACRV